MYRIGSQLKKKVSKQSRLVGEMILGANLLYLVGEVKLVSRDWKSIKLRITRRDIA